MLRISSAVVAVLAVLPLVARAQVGVPEAPVAVDADLGDTTAPLINHTFTTSAGSPPLSWSNLTLVTGSPTAAPTLAADGDFAWHTISSPLGLYAFDATVTNPVGSDTARLTLNLVPEPGAALILALLAPAAAVRRPRRARHA